MGALQEDLNWKARWQERGQAIRNILGDAIPPNTVVPFSWRQHVLPGACALTFPPSQTRSDYLYMTLGLTQPLDPTALAYPWEFSIRARQHVEWPVDLLYQLLTHWLSEHDQMGFGYRLPLTFFSDPSGKTWASIANYATAQATIGSLRWLYLWTDETHVRFNVSTGDFSLLSVVGVTADEDHLAQQATLAHLMLLLRRLGVGQVCDPDRRSVFSMSAMPNEWAAIKGLSHDDVLEIFRGNS